MADGRALAGVHLAGGLRRSVPLDGRQSATASSVRGAARDEQLRRSQQSLLHCRCALRTHRLGDQGLARVRRHRSKVHQDLASRSRHRRAANRRI